MSSFTLQDMYKNYLEFMISMGTTSFICYYELNRSILDKESITRCSKPITDEDIQELVSNNIWNKYLKFKFHNEHHNARDCPNCEHTQAYDEINSRECICENCDEIFCFYHSNAHNGESCEVYEERTRRFELIDISLIHDTTKKCPGCDANVEKNGRNARDGRNGTRDIKTL